MTHKLQQRTQRQRSLAPLLLAVAVAATLFCCALSPVSAAAGSGSASTYSLPLPPSLVSVSSFQRGRNRLGTSGASVLLASNSSCIIGWPWPTATANSRAQMEPIAIDVSHPTPMMDPLNATLPLLDAEGHPVMSPPETPMTRASLTPAAGQIAVDPNTGTVFAVSTSARSLLQFKPLSSGVLGYEAGWWVDLVAAGVGPAQAVTMQTLAGKDAVIVWALPDLDPLDPDLHLPSLLLVNSSGAIQWQQPRPIQSQSCTDHPDFLDIMIQNDGALNTLSATTIMLYVQCGSDVAAFNALTGDLLWQKAHDPSSDTVGFFAHMHSVSSQTGDLFFASDATSIDRLNHESGDAVPAAFVETRKNHPAVPDTSLQLMSVEVLEDSRSCATLTANCTDLQFVHVYEAIPEGDVELRAYMTAYDAQAVAPAPLWDTSAFFQPGGGSHSQPYPVQMQSGRLVLWLVRSNHVDDDGFDLPKLYVVNATDGSLVRSFDLAMLGLAELPLANPSDPSPPPSCEVLDVDSYSLGIVVLSCPRVFGKIIVISDWTVGQPAISSSSSSSSSTAEEGSGESSTGASSSTGDESSSSSISFSSSTGDATGSSSSAEAAAAGLGTGSSSGSDSSSSSSGADSDLAASADVPDDSNFLQRVVLVFVVLFVVLVSCAVFSSLVHCINARRTQSHMRLSQSGGSPRGLGRGIHLDGSIDNEWDPEAQEPHWPSEGGTEMARRPLTAAERAALSDHDRAMLELEEAIGAGLAGAYDESANADALPTGNDDDDEAEFRRAIGQDVPASATSAKTKLNSAPSSSSSYALAPGKKNGAAHKTKAHTVDDDDSFDL